jgi:hypothetical protein
MTSTVILDGLLPALKRLDQLIAQAVASAQAGGGPARDPFRGLHIGLDDVTRWLACERRSRIRFRSRNTNAYRFR